MYRTINHTPESTYYYNRNTKIVCLTLNAYINHTLESTYYYNANTKIFSLKLNVYIDHGLKLFIWMIT